MDKKIELINKYQQSSRLNIKVILNIMRIKHYIKNLLIFIPLIFSLKFLNSTLLFRDILAFMSFSFGASFVYIINDITDIKKDRMHPIKKSRPIASGIISIRQALFLACTLLCVSIIIAFYLNNISLIIILIYIAINALYSFRLKNIPIIDVSIIALGFILRVLIGGTAIYIPISKWLLLTIMAVSFYLGFGKRRNELIKIDKTDNVRKVLKEYNIGFLEKAMNSMFTLSITFYSLWSIDTQVIKSFKSDKVLLTVPIVIIGMFRYSLIIEKDSYGDPTDVILSDRLLQLIIVSYIIIIFILIY